MKLNIIKLIVLVRKKCHFIFIMSCYMCIIIAGEGQPDTTKLMNIPVKINDKSYNFFIYVNNFDLQKESTVGKYYSPLLGRHVESNIGSNDINNNDHSSNSAVMIVPFPVAKGTKISDIGLVDISTDQMKQLRKNIQSLKPASFGSSKGLSRSYGVSTNSIQVHKIGNYNISVATSLNQLINNIDWNTFNKPTDFDKRVKTLHNKHLYPENYAYFYIVASAVENIKDDGFGIIYPQNTTFTYFPTAHEDNADTHKFDVEIYNFGKNLPQKTQFVSESSIQTALNKLNGSKVKFLNNTYNTMTFDPNIDTFFYAKEDSHKKNHNLFLVR